MAVWVPKPSLKPVTATAKIGFNKVIWTMAEAANLLTGSETMAALMRNSRAIVLNSNSTVVYNLFIDRADAWIVDNITNLCVLDVTHKDRLRILFEDKADLAKFLLAFTDYAPAEDFT